MTTIAYLAENFGNFPKPDLDLAQVMHLSGNNVGNFAFWNAARRLVDADIRCFGFGAKPESLGTSIDAVMIPAANFLNPTGDLGWLARLIVQIDKPCVVVGLGAQSESEDEIPALKDGTVQFLRQVGRRTPFIGVRGAFSKRVCEQYGVRNVRVMGCPSLFTNADRRLGQAVASRWKRPIAKLAIHAACIKGQARQAERALFARLYEQPGSSYIIQRPVELMKVCRGESLTESDERYVDKSHGFLAPDLSRSRFVDTLRAFGTVPYSVDSWIYALGGHSHSVGTRIHGAMMSLAAGLPTVCITHDTRTRELCETMRVPSIGSNELRCLGPVSDLFASIPFDAQAFEDNRTRLAHEYLSLVNEAGLGPSEHLRRLAG